MRTAQSFVVICLSASALSVSAMGCWDGYTQAGSYAPAPTGELSIEWTVDNATDPRACDDNHAASMQIAVYDSAGNLVENEVLPCSAFGVVLTLPADNYTADATMLDDNGGQASTTLPLNDLEVTEGTNLTVTSDFPRSSFY